MVSGPQTHQREDSKRTEAGGGWHLQLFRHWLGDDGTARDAAGECGGGGGKVAGIGQFEIASAGDRGAACYAFFLRFSAFGSSKTALPGGTASLKNSSSFARIPATRSGSA